MSQENNKKLSKEELENTNGGGLLGLDGDDSMLKGIVQGGVDAHDTDRDGKTRSNGIDLGLGSVLDNQND